MSLCKKNSDVFQYIPKDIQEDPEFLKRAVSVNGLVIKNADSQLLLDRQINYLAVKNNAIAFKFIHPNYKTDFGLAKLAISQRPELFFGLDNTLKNNPEIVKASFQSNPDYTYFIYRDKISSNLQQNESVSITACSSNLNCLLEVPTETFLSTAFKKDLKDLLERKESAIVHNSSNPDEELENFKSIISDLLSQKEDLIIQEKLNASKEESTQGLSTKLNSITENQNDTNDDKFSEKYFVQNEEE